MKCKPIQITGCSKQLYYVYTHFKNIKTQKTTTKVSMHDH